MEKTLKPKRFKNFFEMQDSTLDNPVVKASHVWRILSDQLKDILGHEIYDQWFSQIIPIVISDNVLILRAKRKFDVVWINNQYQELVDLLLSFIDGQLTSFFLSPSDLCGTSLEA